MIYSTNKYNLQLNSVGRISRILKELLYQIPEVQSSIPQVNQKEHRPSFNDKFDATTQAAVTFFQK